VGRDTGSVRTPIADGFKQMAGVETVTTPGGQLSALFTTPAVNSADPTCTR
jgi:hypothetical protein